MDRMACIGIASMVVVTSLSGTALEIGRGRKPVEVLNRGIGGNTSRDAKRRFDKDVIAAKPQHLIIYFGINDALNSAKLVPLSEFKRNMRWMVEKAKKAGMKSILLVTPNPIVAGYVKQRHSHHPAADLDAHLRAYVHAVRDMAVGEGVILADLHEWIDAARTPGDDPQSLIRNLTNSHAADGVHLTVEGYRMMAEKLAAILAPRIAPGDRVLCFGDSITYGAHMPGAGTAKGETYPAWLSFFLNRAIGLAHGSAPPPTTPRQ